MAYIPNTNQSVSGTIGASVVGHAPVVIVGGSVAANFTPPANQSVSGTVQADIQGSVATVIIGGSILTSSTPNQSVSGTVNVGNLPANQSVSGAINITGSGSSNAVNTLSGSDGLNNGNIGLVTAGFNYVFNGTNWDRLRGESSIGALVSTGMSSVITVPGANWPGSVVAVILSKPSISGTIATTQQGTWISSIVNTVPSSVIVGASAFGIFPVTGTVTANQGTGFGSVASHIKSGSVVAVLGGNTSVVAITNISSISTANGALPIFAQLPNRVQGVADLRVVQGASVAAIAAQGAGVRTYIDHVQVSNFGSSSVLVVIADNTTSILGWTIAPAGSGSNYNCFYRPVANSPITASINGTASVLVSLQGFTASI